MDEWMDRSSLAPPEEEAKVACAWALCSSRTSPVATLAQAKTNKLADGVRRHDTHLKFYLQQLALLVLPEKPKPSFVNETLVGITRDGKGGLNVAMRWYIWLR